MSEVTVETASQPPRTRVHIRKLGRNYLVLHEGQSAESEHPPIATFDRRQMAILFASRRGMTITGLS